MYTSFFSMDCETKATHSMRIMMIKITAAMR